MADAATVAAVLNDLPDEADMFGVTADTVGALLDSGVSQTKTTLASWRSIAAKAATVADVSESGSSRSLGNIFENAARMIEIWQGRADAEDKASTVEPETGKARARVHTAVRV